MQFTVLKDVVEMRFSDLRLTKFGIVLLADAALLLVVWLILLVSWGGGASWLVHLLLVTAVVFVAIAFWGRPNSIILPLISTGILCPSF